MMDSKNIIERLKCCIAHHPEDYSRCDECPHVKDACYHLKDEALALIKASEPRVMSLVDAQGTDYVWYESRQTGCVFPASVCMSSETWHGELTTDVQQIGYGGYKFVLDKEYNRAWRCWNHRPTDEQRQAIPWD